MIREIRWQQLDEDFTYTGKELDRSVVAQDQIRTVIRTFRDRVLTEIFPGREEVPKTLVFAKDDSHAEDIVRMMRKEFAKGNEFCQKITYRTTGKKVETLIQELRNSYYPRIAVTVDMVSTGTDIKPLECLLFMRDVKSRTYFEQMKGRGTRTINPNDFQEVAPDARFKDHFVIVDAVGVCDSDKTDSRPLERKRNVPFKQLLQGVAVGVRDEDSLTSLAGRLARLDRRLGESDRSALAAAAGQSLPEITQGLLAAFDPDEQIEAAKQQFNQEPPTPEQLEESRERLVFQACQVFDHPGFRNLLLRIKTKHEQIIDTVSQDIVLEAGFDRSATEKARGIVESFEQFIEENKAQITALQLLYNRPYGQRQLTYEQIRQLAEALQLPPYNLTPEKLWQAYQQLAGDRVRGAGVETLLTDIVSLVSFAIGEAENLEPFAVKVEERFQNWLAGRDFSPEQVRWLEMIQEYIATSMRIEAEDLEDMPFVNEGGVFQAYELFGEDLTGILVELNEVLAG
ncbi:MAG: type I restriction-modification enzyme R subunit C-terminal domain-containing protein [Coleofasciculus sp.]